AGAYRLGQELGLPVVATNDAHYLRKDDAEAHDVLLAIGTGKDLDDPNRFRFFGQESYVKSEAEMQRLFPEHPEVVAETARVAERSGWGRGAGRPPGRSWPTRSASPTSLRSSSPCCSSGS